MTANRIRAVAAAQVVLGSWLAARPDAAIAAVGIQHRQAPPAWLVRVLGARITTQAALEFARPTRDVARVGAGVDVAHALSMVAVAAVSRRFRRGAALSALIAAASAAALAGVAGGKAR